MPSLLSHTDHVDPSLLESAREYWIRTLANATASPFPEPPTAGQVSQKVVRGWTTLAPQPLPNVSSTTDVKLLLKAAWALVVSRYTDAGDVTFGVVEHDDLPVSEAADSFARHMVPTHVVPDPLASLSHYLDVVKAEDDRRKSQARLSLAEIRELSLEASQACGFQNLLVLTKLTHDLPHQLERLAKSSDQPSHPLLIICEVNGARPVLAAVYDSRSLAAKQAARILHQLEHVMLQLSDPDNSLTVQDVSALSASDVEEISEWNKHLPDYVDRCVHHIVTEQAERRPDADAVCSWDGKWSHRELDQLSTQLAYHLRELGLGREDVVPLLFEKSKWHAVAMLGVLKSGAAFVPLDYSSPANRLRELVLRLSPKVVIRSREARQIDLGAVRYVEMSSHASESLPKMGSLCEQVNSHNAAYMVFTSGSTGTPKGVVIEHGAFCTKSDPRCEALGRSESSRVLQFASFSFDLSIEDVLTTLMFGGCVCYPSENDRTNNLTGVINDMGATCAHITPSLANTLYPEDLPSLVQLRLGGEAMTKAHVKRWARMLDLRNGYGPAECSVTAAVSPQMGLHSDPVNMGFAVACRSWIVDPDNHDRLTPIGCVGELLIEGHILARGYYNDSAQTSKSFITDPLWSLVDGSRDTSYRPRRFYKTGDLAVYASNGTLRYMGRKDTQCKLRGQRIELGEVEAHLKRHSPYPGNLAAEVIKLSADPADTWLVAFMALGQEYRSGDATALHIAAKTKSQMSEAATLMVSQMRANLPNYMIPQAFVPMQDLPKTVSLKTDRKMLRTLGLSLGSAGLSDFFV